MRCLCKLQEEHTIVKKERQEEDYTILEVSIDIGMGILDEINTHLGDGRRKEGDGMWRWELGVGYENISTWSSGVYLK